MSSVSLDSGWTMEPCAPYWQFCLVCHLSSSTSNYRITSLTRHGIHGSINEQVYLP